MSDPNAFKKLFSFPTFDEFNPNFTPNTPRGKSPHYDLGQKTLLATTVML